MGPNAKNVALFIFLHEYTALDASQAVLSGRNSLETAC